MLDELEYSEAFRLYRECMKGVKEFRLRWNVPLEGASVEERFRPVREWYERLTGVADCHENVVHQPLVHLRRALRCLRQTAPNSSSEILCCMWLASARPPA